MAGTPGVISFQNALSSMFKYLCRFKFCLLICLFTGCSTLGNGRSWGQDVNLLPRVSKVRAAAVKAARDPRTWLPAAGALAMSAAGFDKKVSQWATTRNPVFGSPENALRASDALRSATEIAFVSTALMTPSGQYVGEFTTNKLKGLGVEVAAAETVSMTTSALKDATGRTRPNGSNDSSFPSAHASSAFSYAALSRRNLEATGMHPRAKQYLNYTVTALAAGTAWARVEGEAHYPSDVLAGAAVGNFISNFFYDTFLKPKDEDSVDISVKPQRKGAVVEIKIPF